ncbi:MAG TPA: zf-HC2 domain-containing protein [Polyangiaceae bacterium]|nr:zf-HC2 domain-containing protein [Polyangiaceae bacterium]
MSECQATREQLLDAVRGRLAEPQRAHFTAHLQTCSECRRLFEREQALERALELRPRFTLPDRLRESLAATATAGASAKPAQTDNRTQQKRLVRWAAVLVPGLAAALLGLLLVLHGQRREPLIDEAINDHLRVLYAAHPVEIESGGIHQVKPWFAGKLDFAPVLDFSGDEEFPLQGGAIALFVDRKAATFIFKHRLHIASLFVFRSQDLSFPGRTSAEQSIGRRSATSAAARGYNVLLWQDHDLGYALVSDMDPSSLARLAEKLTAR